MFTKNLNVSRDKVEGNIEIRGNKINCFPRDQSSGDLLYSKTKQKQILKNALRFLQLHALITCNSGQHFSGNSALFPV